MENITAIVGERMETDKVVEQRKEKNGYPKGFSSAIHACINYLSSEVPVVLLR